MRKPAAAAVSADAVQTMEARLVERLPDGADWQFEPKWDGFRCLGLRDGAAVDLRGKSGKSLGRYFPEIVATLGALDRTKFLVDGELAIPLGESLSFDALQMRLHPAESRVRKLSVETPAIFIMFDCLATERGSLIDAPLVRRRAALEEFFGSLGREQRAGLRLTPFTREQRVAQGWLERSGGALDGVVAKRLQGPYEPGERAMLKVKTLRTADCVVGGFRYAQGSRQVGSLLLGLYDAAGRLDHVGFTSAIADADRKALTQRLEALRSPPGFSGNAPGGPSRWSTDRSAQWEPLRPDLVAEVRYDQVTSRRFRHGTMFLRWRPDKTPQQCTFDQLQQEARPGKLIGDVLAEPR